jgi:organic radical activating enzyme
MTTKVNKQRIYQIFKTLQGEGAYIGLPVLLIRFASCNLRCKFCDSYENWSNPGKDFSPEELINYILTNYIVDSVQNVSYELNDYLLMFTGGEPLMTEDRQAFIVEVSKLWNEYSGKDFVIIETNGTNPIIDDFVYCNNIKFHFSISPKEMRYQHKYVDTYPKLVDQLNNMNVNNISFSLKFVYESSQTQEFILTLAEKVRNKAVGIFVMPEGATREKQLNNSYETLLFCAKHNLIFSPRLHILQDFKEKEFIG